MRAPVCVGTWFIVTLLWACVLWCVAEAVLPGLRRVTEYDDEAEYEGDDALRLIDVELDDVFMPLLVLAGFFFFVGCVMFCSHLSSHGIFHDIESLLVIQPLHQHVTRWCMVKRHQ